MQSGEFQLAELRAQLTIPGLGREQYLTLLGLQKAISSHRNIPDACRLQDLFKFRDIGVMLHDDARNSAAGCEAAAGTKAVTADNAERTGSTLIRFFTAI